MSARLALQLPTLGLTAALALIPGTARTQDFRIETDVFVDDEREPRFESLTIFQGDYVYDFSQNGNQEVTVLDQRRQRFILLDPKLRRQTSFTTAQVLEVNAYLRAQSATDKRSPPEKFAVSIDEQDRRVTVVGERLKYTAQAQTPRFELAAALYQNFADWYVRLNAMRQGNPPPFARIRLNTALADKGWIPERVERTQVGGRGKVWTRHYPLWILSRTDRERLANVGEMMATYTAVSPEEYWKRDAAKQDDK